MARDALQTDDGLKALRSYRKEWDEEKGIWRDTPRHDKARYPQRLALERRVQIRAQRGHHAGALPSHARCFPSASLIRCPGPCGFELVVGQNLERQVKSKVEPPGSSHLGRASGRGPSRFVRRRSTPLPEATSRLFRVGGSMTASGIPSPRGRSVSAASLAYRALDLFAVVRRRRHQQKVPSEGREKLAKSASPHGDPSGNPAPGASALPVR